MVVGGCEGYYYDCEPLSDAFIIDIDNGECFKQIQPYPFPIKGAEGAFIDGKPTVCNKVSQKCILKQEFLINFRFVEVKTLALNVIHMTLKMMSGNLLVKC